MGIPARRESQSTGVLVLEAYVVVLRLLGVNKRFACATGEEKF